VSTREEVESGILVYTCNCGWLDTGHADSRSRRPHVGAESLWQQVTNESGIASRRKGANGFKVAAVPPLRRVPGGGPVHGGVPADRAGAEWGACFAIGSCTRPAASPTTTRTSSPSSGVIVSKTGIAQ
jgi:hypothetical protein